MAAERMERRGGRGAKRCNLQQVLPKFAEAATNGAPKISESTRGRDSAQSAPPTPTTSSSFWTLHHPASGSPRGWVLLLGWYGAKPRHLAKYAAVLCEEAGLGVATAAAPTSVVFSPFRDTQRRFARAALEAASSELPDRRAPFVLMLMSNGGAFIYAEMIELLQEPAFRPLAARHRATVFDSAPGYPHARTGLNALRESVRSPLVRALLAAFYFALLLLGALLHLVTANTVAGTFWRRLRADPLPAPTLYLYGADDHLIDASQLEALIAERTAQGVAPITSRRWERSEHVAHLRWHPEEYRTALLGFLRRHFAREPAK